MTPLDAAKAWQAQDYRMQEGSRYATCWVCQKIGEGHAVGCLFLDLPKIVAALEAAEKIAAVSPDDESVHGPYGCHFCDGVLLSNDKQTFPETGHAEDCPWQALVASLQDEST